MTSSSTLDLVKRVTEIDVDGYVDSKGVRYIGRAVRMDDGTWRVDIGLDSFKAEFVKAREIIHRAVDLDGPVTAEPGDPHDLM